MSINGPDYSFDPPFDRIAQNLLSELGSQEAIEALPYAVMFRVMTHPDETHFISAANPEVQLEGIIGPYNVYDEDRAFLCTVNLHKGYFGSTLPERGYVRKLPPLTSIYVCYTDRDGMVRDIQLIKR